jgi:hypothetical protein
MTKDLFRRLAMSAIDQVLSIPDDLWEMTRPIVGLTVGNEKVVGKHVGDSFKLQYYLSAKAQNLSSW